MDSSLIGSVKTLEAIDLAQILTERAPPTKIMPTENILMFVSHACMRSNQLEFRAFAILKSEAETPAMHLQGRFTKTSTQRLRNLKFGATQDTTGKL